MTTTTRKPALPHAAHIAIASKVSAAIADAPIAVVDSLPAKVKESLDYFREVTEVAERIATEQPDALDEYRTDILASMDSAGPETEAMVDALLSSHVMARILADVASGAIEPVAVTAKARPAAAPAKRTAAPRKPRKTAAATPAPQPGKDGLDPYFDADAVAAARAGDPAPADAVEPDPFADADVPVEPANRVDLYPADPLDNDF